MTDHAPPVDPCMWIVFRELTPEEIGPPNGYPQITKIGQEVGPCKTAYDAWKMSGLPGDFGAYEYEPIRKDEE